MQLLEVVTFILYDQLYTDNLYTVNYPASSWASGCYKMNLDQSEGFKIHEDLNERIDFFVKRGFI